MVEKTARLLNATVFPSYEEVRRRRAQTLALPRTRGAGSNASKRSSMLFTGNLRSRTTTSGARAAKMAKRRSGLMTLYLFCFLSFTFSAVSYLKKSLNLLCFPPLFCVINLGGEKFID